MNAMNSMIGQIRIMIDLETLDTSENAGILSFGACTFGLPFGMARKTFYAKASIKSNETLGRKISPSTMQWWDKQDPAIRNEAFSGDLAVDDVLDQFARWAGQLVSGYVDEHDPDLTSIELWSRGAGFDCNIIQNAYEEVFGKYPFDFRKHMCQRTIERLMPEHLKAAASVTRLASHHALNDAINQANVMDVALRNLNWSGAM